MVRARAWRHGNLGSLAPQANGLPGTWATWSLGPCWSLAAGATINLGIPVSRGNRRQSDQGAWVIDVAGSRGIPVIDGPWRLGLEWPRNQSGEGPRSLGFPFRLGPWSQWAWGPSCRAVQQPWSLGTKESMGQVFRGYRRHGALAPGVPGDQGKSSP